jgi:hypothetical protein
LSTSLFIHSLAIQLIPQECFQIGLLGTLFLGIIFLWFVPLFFEKKSPLLHYFDVFLIKFNVTFGEAGHERVVKV